MSGWTSALLTTLSFSHQLGILSTLLLSPSRTSPLLSATPPPSSPHAAVTFPNCSVGRPVPSTQAGGRGGVPQLFFSGPVPPPHTPTVVASAGENRRGAPAYPLPYFPPTSQVEWGSGSSPREGGAARRNSPPHTVNKDTENPKGRLRYPLLLHSPVDTVLAQKRRLLPDPWARVHHAKDRLSQRSGPPPTLLPARVPRFPLALGGPHVLCRGLTCQIMPIE